MSSGLKSATVGLGVSRWGTNVRDATVRGVGGAGGIRVQSFRAVCRHCRERLGATMRRAIDP